MPEGALLGTVREFKIAHLRFDRSIRLVDGVEINLVQTIKDLHLERTKELRNITIIHLLFIIIIIIILPFIIVINALFLIISLLIPRTITIVLPSSSPSSSTSSPSIPFAAAAPLIGG
uniref:Uncharacterized protein n=1 Tax=Ananas comosus var. bracteatus TaxID=296719 RepID=A0A6V7P115_ANACO|nr:unnamed protein product [Ananas comosus var. bracteatus]